MSVRLKVSVGAIEALADRVEASADVIANSQYRVLNRIADKTQRAAQRHIVSSVNLSAAYVAERLVVHPAGPRQPYASIIGRSRPTRLMTYGAKLVTKPAPRAKGDTLRRIAAGQKAAGVSVAVKRGGSRKTLPGAFLIPLRAGKEEGGNGFGVFVRHGSAAHLAAKRNPAVRVGKHRAGAGQLRQLYGPSIDQMFGVLIPGLIPEIEADLDGELIRQIEIDVRRTLAA